MPALIPLAPIIAAGIGAGASWLSGHKAEQMNNANLARADQATAAQQQLIGQLMAGITPDAYRAQAQQAGAQALDQLSGQFAGRGMLSSGALHTAGTTTLAKLYTDAAARYQQDRMQAIGMALGGQQAIQQQWGQHINPDPYSGLGQSLAGLGTAAGQYLYNQQKTGTPQPLPVATGQNLFAPPKYR